MAGYSFEPVSGKSVSRKRRKNENRRNGSAKIRNNRRNGKPSQLVAAEAAGAAEAASGFGGAAGAVAAVMAGIAGYGPALAGFGLANQSASEGKNLRQRLCGCGIKRISVAVDIGKNLSARVHDLIAAV
jgi:hypothetical protein